MQKMEYCRPAADLILFENEDVIMTSKVCPYNPGWECDDSDDDPKCNGQLQWCGTKWAHCSLPSIFGSSNYSDGNGQIDARQYSDIETFDDFSEWRD